MDDSGSVTRLMAELRSDDLSVRNEAARQIWLRYFPPLLALACKRLDPGVRRREDGDDVLQDMYASFCARMGRGEFDLEHRDSLWRLLVTMTLNKARRAVERQLADKRNPGREQAPPASAAEGALTPEEALAQLEQTGPTPIEALELAEGLQRRLRVLDEELRKVALWKLEGHTNKEIAAPDKLNCAERTVERKLELIRVKWEGLAD